MPVQKPVIKPASGDKLIDKKQPLSKEQIITALQAAARELGHTPNSIEFRGLTGITRHKIVRRFKTYQTALYAAGLTPGGMRIETAVLLEDWGKVVRKIDGVPSENEYLRTGSYSRDCFIRRVHSWSRIPAEFCKFVAGGGLAGDWTDVLEKIRQGPHTSLGQRHGTGEEASSCESVLRGPGERIGFGNRNRGSAEREHAAMRWACQAAAR